jgi:hypothetical protein
VKRTWSERAIPWGVNLARIVGAAAAARPAKANASVSAAHQCHLVESAAGRTVSRKPSCLIS